MDYRGLGGLGTVNAPALVIFVTGDMIMTWYQIKVPKSAVSDLAHKALLGMIRHCLGAARHPEGAAVYHRHTDKGERFYFFSPQAAKVCKQTLKIFGARKKFRQPDVTGLTILGGVGRFE